MKMYDIIVSRRTIRRFSQQPVDAEFLKKCVTAASLAPSALNLQPLEYVVVTEKKLCAEVFKALNWAGYIQPKWVPSEQERPTAYISLLIKDQNNRYYQRDVGCASENILLLAQAEGLGSCILCNIQKDVLQHLLRIPAPYTVDSVIALGYIAEEVVVEELTDSVKYWRDEQGVLHVPKRNVESIIHYNTF